MSYDYAMSTESSSAGWVDPTLAVVFLIHTAAFIYLYWKRRHFYTAMLVVAFPLLCSYYTLRALQINFTGMDALRWSGIVIATLSVLLAIKDAVAKRMQPRPYSKS